MIQLLSSAQQEAASQGLNLGIVAVLLLLTLLLMYIPAYLLFRNRKRKKIFTEPPKKQEKTIKPKMKEYDRCDLNEIMGYDFIQTQYIGSEKAKTKNSHKEDAITFAIEQSSAMTEINESVIGVTGIGQNISDDTSEETPTEQRKRIEEELARQATELHTKEHQKKQDLKAPVEPIEQDKSVETEETVPDEYCDHLSKEMIELMNCNDWPEDWDENDDDTDTNAGEWQECFRQEDFYITNGQIEDNDEEDADKMNELAGEAEDPQAYTELLFRSKLWDEAVDDNKGTESHQDFIRTMMDDYVEQPNDGC